MPARNAALNIKAKNGLKNAKIFARDTNNAHWK